MDAPTPPTAAELGISEAEYARILRDVHQRGRTAGGAAPAAPGARRRRLHPLRRGVRLVGALAVIGVLTSWLLDLSPEPVAAPVHAFLQMRGDQPITYSSCQQIQVAVYPAGGPPDAERLVREAVSRVRGATGLDVVVTGSFGGHAPNWDFEAAPVLPGDPISVSWQDGAAIAAMTDHVAGLGGSRVWTDPDGSQRLVGGTIALSRDYYATLTGAAGRTEGLAVLLHEFGHVFGLAHVDSPAELMYSENVGTETFGAGDLAGLRTLGQGPCI